MQDEANSQRHLDDNRGPTETPLSVLPLAVDGWPKIADEVPTCRESTVETRETSPPCLTIRSFHVVQTPITGDSLLSGSNSNNVSLRRPSRIVSSPTKSAGATLPRFTFGPMRLTK